MSEKSEKILNLILQKIQEQEELLLLTISNLTTKKSVASFLKKSERTIDNYIKNGVFTEGVEYIVLENGKKEFVPSAIVDFKRNKKDRKKVEPEKKIFHPSVQNIVQGLRIG